SCCLSDGMAMAPKPRTTIAMIATSPRFAKLSRARNDMSEVFFRSAKTHVSSCDANRSPRAKFCQGVKHACEYGQGSPAAPCDDGRAAVARPCRLRPYQPDFLSKPHDAAAEGAVAAVQAGRRPVAGAGPAPGRDLGHAVRHRGQVGHARLPHAH